MSSSRTLRNLQPVQTSDQKLASDLSTRGFTKSNLESGDVQYSSPLEEYTSYQDKKLRQTGQYSKEVYVFNSSGQLVKKIQREPYTTDAYSNTVMRSIRDKQVDDYIAGVSTIDNSQVLTNLARNQIADNEVKRSGGISQVELRKLKAEDKASFEAYEKARKDNILSVSKNYQTGIVTKTLRSPTYEEPFKLVQQRSQEKRETFLKQFSPTERARIETSLATNPNAIIIGIDSKTVKEYNKQPSKKIPNPFIQQPQFSYFDTGNSFYAQGTPKERVIFGAKATAKEMILSPSRGFLKLAEQSLPNLKDLQTTEGRFTLFNPFFKPIANRKEIVNLSFQDQDVQRSLLVGGIIGATIIAPQLSIPIAVGFTIDGVRRGVDAYYKQEYEQLGGAITETAINVALPFLEKIPLKIERTKLVVKSQPDIIISDISGLKVKTDYRNKPLLDKIDFEIETRPKKSSFTTLGFDIGSRGLPLLTKFDSEILLFNKPSKKMLPLTSLRANLNQPLTASSGKVLRNQILQLEPRQVQRIEQAVVVSRNLGSERGLPVKEYVLNIEGVKNPRSTTDVFETFMQRNKYSAKTFGSLTTKTLPEGFQNIKQGDIDVVFPYKTVKQINKELSLLTSELNKAGENLILKDDNTIMFVETGNKFLEAKSGINQNILNLGDEVPAGYLGFKTGTSTSRRFGKGRSIQIGEQLRNKASASLIINAGGIGETPNFSGFDIIGKNTATNIRGLKDVAGFIQTGKGISNIKAKSLSPLQRMRARKGSTAIDRYFESFTEAQRGDILNKLTDITGSDFKVELNFKEPKPISADIFGSRAVSGSRALSLFEKSPSISASKKSIPSNFSYVASEKVFSVYEFGDVKSPYPINSASLSLFSPLVKSPSSYSLKSPSQYSPYGYSAKSSSPYGYSAKSPSPRSPSPYSPKSPRSPYSYYPRMPISSSLPPKNLKIRHSKGVEGVGYDVYVRESRPKDGKASKRDYKVNKKPLPYNKAYNTGEYYTDESTSRSFRLVQRGKTNLVDDFSMNDTHKHRKSKNGRYFTEKSLYAIDSPTEVLGIPLQALLNKKNNKKRFRFGIKNELIAF